MVLSGRPTRRHAGVPPTPDPGQGPELTRPVGVSPRLLAPNEHLAGTDDAAPLLRRLAGLRTTDTLTQQHHPTLTFLSLPEALRHWQAHGLDAGPFHTGLALLRPRYAALGLARPLPLERVLIGVQSSRPGAFGGFHHPNQGYRHLQMRAVITTYGDLSTGLPADPDLAALDLLRAYAHDCLHYGSYRSYRLHDGDMVRTQYGVNFRRADGRTYSAPDLAGSPTTRNLGIVMEGACDREARLITQAAARRAAVNRTAGMARLAFRDVTGTLNAPDTDTLADPDARAAAAPGPEANAFLRAMGTYQRGVDARYSVFLDEVGGTDAEDLHTMILKAMISGVLTHLSAWLDDHHDPKTFAALFKTPRYSMKLPPDPRQ